MDIPVTVCVGATRANVYAEVAEVFATVGAGAPEGEEVPDICEGGIAGGLLHSSNGSVSSVFTELNLLSARMEGGSSGNSPSSFTSIGRRPCPTPLHVLRSTPGRPFLRFRRCVALRRSPATLREFVLRAMRCTSVPAIRGRAMWATLLTEMMDAESSCEIDHLHDEVRGSGLQV